MTGYIIVHKYGGFSDVYLNRESCEAHLQELLKELHNALMKDTHNLCHEATKDWSNEFKIKEVKIIE
jgi:hypothetical protein